MTVVEFLLFFAYFSGNIWEVQNIHATPLSKV
jgi:hypothetical protein